LSTSSATVRPTRWPWMAFGSFIVMAGLGVWLVALNDESLAEQVPYVVAFADHEP
jgi:hypothetical protein